MIRLQVEAHVGAVTNPEAVKQAGYEVAIQSRKARPGYPSSSSVNASTLPPTAHWTRSSA